MAGWQDDPVVAAAPSGGGGGWQNDPIVGGDKPTSDEKPWLSLTGTDKVGEFVGKMSDAFTGGFGAKALDAAGIGQGPDGQTVAKQVEAAGQDIGPVGSALADVTGYALGPGKLGIAAKLGRGAEALGAGSRLASGLGAAGEAAGATAAGDIGHGETPGWDVALAGTLGGGLGAAAGKAARAPPVGQSIADLQSAKQAAIDALQNHEIGNLPAYRAVDAGINSLTSGEKSGLSRQMQSQLATTQDLIVNDPKITGRDVWSMRKNIGDAAITDEDRVAAKKVGDALHSLTPDLIDDASSAHARSADVDFLMNTKDPAALVKGAQAKLDDPRNLYNLAGKTAMRNLADSAPGRLNRGARNVIGYGINHGIGVAGFGALGGALGHSGIGELLGLVKGTGKLDPGGWIANRGLNAGTTKAKQAALATLLSNRLATPDMYAKMPGVYRSALPLVNAYGASGGS